MSGVGAINAWFCGECARPTVVVHVDEGVTPFMLGCRRTQDCGGVATSAGYPHYPPEITESITHEWYRPTGKDYQRQTPEMRAHIDAGGLAIRPLTDAGRTAL